AHFDRQRVLNQWILLPDTKLPPAAAPGIAALSGPARAVPLYALGDVRPVRTPDEQWRENQQPAIFVTSEMNEEEAGLNALVADIRERMARDAQLPAGCHWDMGGRCVRQKRPSGG